MDERFTQAEGTNVYTGCELLVKGALESGVSLLTGYPGSPLAEVFDVIQRNAVLLKENGIVAQIANNEALSIARLNGSQMAEMRAIAFMKSVGLHVASDALAISNLAGTTGGAVVVVGDDTWGHSTQVPADSRFLARHLYTPLIEPGTFQELKDWVDIAFQISKEANLYVVLLATQNQADGGGNVELHPNVYPQINQRNPTVLDTALIDASERVVLPPDTARIERETLEERLPQALETARALKLNVITWPDRGTGTCTTGKSDTLNEDEKYAFGFVTAGFAYSYLRHALRELNMLDDIPTLKLGMTHPLDTDIVREFAQQVDACYVVEEKRALLENELKALLTQMYQNGELTRHVQVWGKQFPEGLNGLPVEAGLDTSILIQRLAPLFKFLSWRKANGGGKSVTRDALRNPISALPISTFLENVENDNVVFGLRGDTSSHQPHPPNALRTIEKRLANNREIFAREEALQKRASEQQFYLPQRTPTFCPGCPHRDSSSVLLQITEQFMDADYMKKQHNSPPVDLVFHGDIGCYSMLKYEPFPRLMHNLSAMALGGAAGAGIDAFIKNKQVVFMGDSTFFHGGMAAISDSIKNGQDIAYIILDNQTTAMTGHQPTPAGDTDILGNPTFAQDIEKVVRGLAGDSEIDIVRTNPENRETYKKYLEKTILNPGVKIVIADKECAITYHRRLRREEQKTIAENGFLAREKHINITHEVCEFCLECTKSTGCPALKIIPTARGDKIGIDMSTCVTDGACARIKSACPAFEEVIITRKRPPRPGTKQEQDLPRQSIVGDLEGESRYRQRRYRVTQRDVQPPTNPSERLANNKKTWSVYAAGVGGMGIGTISKILVVAGHLQGYNVTFCDRKGLAIRNGGVYTHVTYSQPGVPVAPIIPYGKADLVLGLDILEAVRGIDANSLFRVASPECTVAVVNTAKTETMSTLIGKDEFDIETLEAALKANTNAAAYFGEDLFAISEQLFGNKVYANMMILGTAFQRGLIPLELEPLHLALKQMVRPADLETNLKAFNVGRQRAVNNQKSWGTGARAPVEGQQDYAALLTAKREILQRKDSQGLGKLYLFRFLSWRKADGEAKNTREPNCVSERLANNKKRLAQDYQSLVESTVATLNIDDDTHRTLALYIYDMVQFQDIAYARRYAEKVLHVHAHDSEAEAYRATKAAIHALHRVMLIKDEVYVAHLLTSEEKLRRDKQRYNVDEANGDRIHYLHLNRPRFTVMGIDVEADIDTRNWQLNLMKRMKFLRRWLSQWHAKEKAFRDWYLTRVIDTFAPNDSESYENHVRAIEAVETVRGYREIRYRKMESAKSEVLLYLRKAKQDFQD